MAQDVRVGLVDSWPNLRANPVFGRTCLPRGLRGVVRSPVVRAVALSALGLVLYEFATRTILPRTSLMGIVAMIVFAILFWFSLRAVQRYFCWIELWTLSSTGTLEDYINSGLHKADVAMGVLYPAEVAESIATTGVLAYFAITSDTRTFQVVLAVIIFLNLKRMFGPPYLSMPDVETYLRRRGPLALFFIGSAALIPIAVWFAILFTMLFTASFAFRLLGLPTAGGLPFLAAFLAAMFIDGLFARAWQRWRLKRFYSRYQSFEDLFDRFLEGPS